jgi:filamentous hemagglutinin family protein
VFLFVIISVEAIYANPTGGVVTSGDATITQAPNTTTINQSSDKAIINWNSFNIGANEATHFQQPNSNSITLNRINPDQGASQIFGQLTANGRIVLVNQSGIFFASGARVDVGGLIASTSGITDQNFLAGKLIFDQTSAQRGTIVNQGTIIAAQNGLVALIGSNVSNEGLIQANGGHVILASGNKFTLDLSGDGLINFVVNEASSGSGTDQNGNVMRDGVKNTGTIIADGGKILLTAKNAQGVVDNAINMTGVVQARSVSQHNGEIIFSSDSQGKIIVAGKVDASGKAYGQKGGKVKILAGNIQLKSTANIDVSGDTGGGEILVGGNFHGTGPELHAATTIVDAGAILNANALTYGNGGQVAIWSDLYTGFHGSITAQGGALGGNGGFVETSGGYLNVAGGTVNTLALNGSTGHWLLDPSDIYIATDYITAVLAGMQGSDFTADIDNGGTFAASGGTVDSLLTIDSLITALNTSNVLVTTTNPDGTGIGNIIVVSPITWATTNTLTLNAENNIIVNSNGLNPAINATAGGGLTLIAANNIILNGGITLTSTNTTNGLLTVTAANSTSSITTANAVNGSAMGGAINVGNFNLLQGQWYQNSANNAAFTVANNFQIESGIATPVNSEFLRSAGGNGSSGNPYQLTDIYGLQGINSESSNAHNLLTQNFILNNNIDATNTTKWNSNAGFIPIGNLTYAHTGTFDGNGKIISNLYIYQAGSNPSGLFGINSGILKNLGLVNVNIITNDGSFIGALAGRSNLGTISNVYSTGSITLGDGAGWVGGLIGYLGGTLSNSYSTVNITGGSNDFGIGGLLGGMQFNGTTGISNSYSTGTISTQSNGSAIGGLIGRLLAAGVGTINISNVYSSSSITNGGNTIGGLIGTLLVVGGGTVNISNAYSLGAVIASSGADSVAGLIGSVYKDGPAGALNIINTYSSGLVSATGGTNVGGLIGVNTLGVITNSFWDVNTSGIGTDGSTNGSAGGTGMSTANLLSASTYTGWDITSTISTSATRPTNTWFIFEGNTRPILMMEYSTNITNGHQLQLAATTLGANYTLANNIDLSSEMSNASGIWGSNSITNTGKGFFSIGDNTNNFNQHFNGGNHTISGLYINQTNGRDVGLFGVLGSGSNVSNLGLLNANVNNTALTGYNDSFYTGILSGEANNSTITNVYTTGVLNVAGDFTSVIDAATGGLTGTLTSSASITGSHNAATITAMNNMGSTNILIQNIGGLVGTNTSSGGVNNSYNTGQITVGNYINNVGGIVGNSTGSTYSNIYNSGNITTGDSATSIGGLIGLANSSTISNSYNNGNITVTALTNSIGGVLGNGTGNTISNVYNLGNISAWENTDSIGGIIGQSDSDTLSSSYNSGNITGGRWNIGGISGISFNGITSDIYNTGTITTNGDGLGGTSIGGLFGIMAGGTLTNAYNSGNISSLSALLTNQGIAGTVTSGATISNSFWDTSSSNQTNAVNTITGGGSLVNVTGGTFDGSSGVNLSDLSTYTNAGWDMTSTIKTNATAPTNTWFIFAGSTRPMLMSEYSTTITNGHQLQLAGTTLGANYTLANNINLSSGMTNSGDIWGTNSVNATGKGFVPIGSSSNFTGIFNGAGYTISNLYINSTVNTGNPIGLFGYSSGTLTNIGVINANIISSGSSQSQIGMLAGYNGGNISNSYSSGTITATNNNYAIGGLVGDLAGSINNSYSNAIINSQAGFAIGGLVGSIFNNSIITNSYSTGSIMGTNNTDVTGGLIGFIRANTVTIANVYSSTAVTTGVAAGLIGGIETAGGIVNISNAYSTGAFLLIPVG